jgi:hypothetical protein
MVFENLGIHRRDAARRTSAWAAALIAAHSCFAQTPDMYHARADQALQSFLLKFWNGGQP